MNGIKVGTFQAGKTAITGVGFKPMGIFFYTANLTANGYGVPVGSSSVWEVANGFAARAGDEAVSTYAWDGGANGETKNLTTRALEFPNRNVVNGRGTMTVDSYDVDGFTVSYPVSPTAPYLIGYIAFDCTNAKTFNQMWGLSNSNVFAGFGFQPDFISHWLNGAYVNTNRTTSGSPSESALGTSVAGRNVAQTTSPGSTTTRSNGIAVSSLIQAMSWARAPGPYGFWGAAIFFSQWQFDIASWDADGFTLSETVDQTQMALLGMALAGEDMHVETGKVTLAANMDDVVITTTDVTVPKAFMFHTQSDSRDSAIADEYDTVAVATGAYDGESQFHCGTAFNSTGQFDDRYCVKWDGYQGHTTASPLALEAVSLVGDTLTLEKQSLPAGGETFRWIAIGLSAPHAVSMYWRT